MNVIAYLRLVRFSNVLFVGLFQILLRWCVILPILGVYEVAPALETSSFVLLVIATMALTASGNAINDYFDARCDSINRPNSQVIDRLVDRKAAILLHVFLTLVGVMCGLYLAFELRKESYALFFVAIPVVLWFYSTHFKKQMLIGNLVVALMMALTTFIVASAEIAAIVAQGNREIVNSTACNQIWTYTAVLAFFAFITNLSREIIKDMEDVDGDAQCKCRTLPIEMGIRNSKVIVIFLELFMIFVLWLVYFKSSTLMQVPYLWCYCLLFVTMPTMYICIMISKASTIKDYHSASMLSKIIMATGAFAMVYCQLVTA